LKKIFYIFKPLIPRSLQIFLRRQLVRQQRKKYADVWPILPSSAETPAGWQGWPGGKKFAVVLTHDVELQHGHDRCEQLMKIEKDLGFVSSFNFVPERYNVSPSLRKLLTENGFEVGVHGLNHDGKLFQNKNIFDERAEKINKYIKEWDVVGFRAPAMHHNLEWIHKLDIVYDLSTFDTDPFEPQSDGVGNIFPFIVENENKQNSYVELPYTLVQDFTLFILMAEKDIKVWTDKIDWIFKKGGMVLVNVHPDYVNFDNKNSAEEFPVDLYIDLLKYLKEKYRDDYWHALPKNVAKFVFNQFNNALSKSQTLVDGK
jgi:peptidoglycan/xylan/chitin deacetylase (PgdA/CDA1 family)